MLAGVAGGQTASASIKVPGNSAAAYRTINRVSSGEIGVLRVKVVVGDPVSVAARHDRAVLLRDCAQQGGWRAMAFFSPGLRPVDQSRDKGLRTGALGLASSVVMGVASVAPAYSLAATLFFVV